MDENGVVKILVAEDSESVRSALVGQLRETGDFEVVDAADGVAALDLLLSEARTGNPVRMIISDWQMPRASGLDFLQAVRNTPETAQIPFILVTTQGEVKCVVEAVRSGVTDYVVKPVQMSILVAKIRTALKLPAKK